MLISWRVVEDGELFVQQMDSVFCFFDFYFWILFSKMNGIRLCVLPFTMFWEPEIYLADLW